MDERYSRTRMIMGDAALERLADAHVAVFGVGGVGGYVVEALARCGIGHIELIDNDRVCMSNLNRQIIATESSLGRYKVDVAEERIHDINPDIQVTVHRCFYLPDGRSLYEAEETVTGQEGEVSGNRVPDNDAADNKAVDNEASDNKAIDNEASDGVIAGNGAIKIDFGRFDYVVDAVDTVTAKLGIICEAKRLGIPVISVMGCGNRLDPTALKVADIYETMNDPLSKIMRKELKKRGIKSLKTVFSTEEAIKPTAQEPVPEQKPEQLSIATENTSDGSAIQNSKDPITENGQNSNQPQVKPARRSTPGSAVFVPAAAGMIAAAEVCRELAGIQNQI